MNFREWLQLEAHHVAKRDAAGEKVPMFTFNGKKITGIDMKFEQYDNMEMMNKLLGWSSYYGKIPGEKRVFFNNHDKGITGTEATDLALPHDWVHLPDQENEAQNPNGEHWWNYAEVHFEDGSIKNPTKERTPADLAVA